MMAVDQAIRDKIAARYPSHAWLVDEPDIAALFEQAVNEEWEPDLLISRIQATEWWRSRSDKMKQWVALEKTNPGEATNRVNEMKSQIVTLSSQLGKALSDNDAGALAWAASREGWSSQQLRQAIAARVQPSGTSVGMMDVRKLANDYFLNPSEDVVSDLTRRLFTGEMDEKTLQAWMAEQASSKFPTLGEWIKRGVIPAAHFSEHKRLISQYTDIPEGQIDLSNDPTWQRIISNPVPGEAPRPMSIAEATTYIRSTKQFAESNTGRRERAAYIDGFRQMLGVAD